MPTLTSRGFITFKRKQTTVSGKMWFHSFNFFSYHMPLRPFTLSRIVWWMPKKLWKSLLWIEVLRNNPSYHTHVKAKSPYSPNLLSTLKNTKFRISTNKVRHVSFWCATRDAFLFAFSEDASTGIEDEVIEAHRLQPTVESRRVWYGVGCVSGPHGRSHFVLSQSQTNFMSIIISSHF